MRLNNRRCVWTGLLGLLCFYSGVPCAAQEKSLTDLYTWHAFTQSMLATQTIYSQAIYMEARRMELERLGKQRIQAGKATTSFQRAPVHFAPEMFAAQLKDPDQRQKMISFYTKALQSFEAYATQNKAALNDVAEARGLAFALAFEVYSNGQRVNGLQRTNFSEQARGALLQDRVFQGTPDKDRQIEVEKLGINAVLAAGESALARNTNNPALRDGAVQIAAETLKQLWTGPVGSIELTSTGVGDRGARLIREGTATTRLVLTPAPIVTDPHQIELWRQFVQLAQSKGIPVNDLGETQALALAINYKVYSGRALNAVQFQWARREMRSDILGDAAWQGFTDHEKQQRLETWAINAVEVAAELQEASKVAPEQLHGEYLAIAQAAGMDNASMARAAVEKVRQTAKANLVELFSPRVFDNYVLAESGFVLQSGTQR